MRCLITGVTGTLGETFLQKLLFDSSYHEIWGISRDEQKQRNITPHKRVKLRICDIRDEDALDDLAWEMQFCDRIFHFASLKCIDTLETAPLEAFKTNVLGTHNIINFAHKIDCKKIVFTSTDKAVYPINAYGQSKAMAEKLILNDSKNHIICRYGNILGSRGSFLPILAKTLINEKTAYVTSTDMTRFWMSINHAANFVMECSNEMEGGIFIDQKMKSSNIVSLIETTAEILDVSDYTIKNIGIRPGEKIHEILCSHYDKLSGASEISSKDCLMPEEELEQLLRPILLEITINL